MYNMSTSVVHACLERYFCIALVHMKFDIVFFIFMVMCLLKLSLLSSIPPRYLTSELILMTSLPAISGDWILFAVEFWNQMLCIQFLAFSFSLIWSIKDFIVPNVASSFSLLHFSFCVSDAGNDFLSEWSSANPFIIISSGTTLSIRTL